jgi:membrane protein DedA with SNARE-associated domain
MFLDLTNWVTNVIDALGYVGVALLIALENLFPPIPSEIVLPFAGFVARDGDAALWGMVVAATIGSMAGAIALYAIAAAIGPERLQDLVIRHGKWLRLSVRDLERAEQWFDRRAVVAVLVGRCIPLIRSLVSIPAGFRRMPLPRFVIYSTVGSLVWNTALIGAGYLLRDRWDDVEPAVKWLQYLVIAAILVAIAWFVWSRFLSRSGRRRSEAHLAAQIRDAEEGRLGGRRARVRRRLRAAASRQGPGGRPDSSSGAAGSSTSSTQPDSAAMTSSSKAPGGSGAPNSSSKRRIPPST